MSDNKLTTGIFILGAGIFILLGKWGVFNFLGSTLWPLLILIPGILLHIYYFSTKRSPEVVIPAGILTVYGIVFLIANIWGIGVLAHLWPAFILGIALGLYEYDLFATPRPQGVFLVSLILTVVSLSLFGFTLLTLSVIYLLAILLIAAGLWLIFSRGTSRRGW